MIQSVINPRANELQKHCKSVCLPTALHQEQLGHIQSCRFLQICAALEDEIDPDPRPHFSVTQRRLGGELGSDFVSVFPWARTRAAICKFPSVARPSVLTAMHNAVTLCSLLVSFRMSAIWQTLLTFTVLSEQGEGFACHQPHKHTHCMGLAACLAFPSYSVAHPFCTSQPGCIISLVYNNNSFLFQNSLALLATTWLVS